MQAPMLTDFRVLDCTSGDASLCGRILADLGADVIKVEPPDGDPARIVAANAPAPDVQGPSHYWSFLNLNKRGITLDLQSEQGHELLSLLLQSADVLVESFPPGLLRSIGFDHGSILQRFPRLVMTSISWFGQSGPYAELPMTDITSLAMAGHLTAQGFPDRPPNRMSVDQAMLLAAAEAAAGTCMALMAREQFGFGQHVDVAVHDVVVELFSRAALARWQTERTHLHRQGDQAMASLGLTARRSVFRCADGYINFQILGGVNSHFVQKLADWMTECGWQSDVAEIDWMAYEYGVLDPRQLVAAEQEFERFFLTKTSDELLRESHKRRLMILPILTPAKVLELEPLLESGYLAPQHLEGGREGSGDPILAPGPYFFSSLLSWREGRPAPRVGEHNDEILSHEPRGPGAAATSGRPIGAV